jgi:peptidoglycan/LPS O-acetylase OafA/YrhL
MSLLSPSRLEPTADRDKDRSGWDVLSFLRFFLALIVALSHLKDFAPIGPVLDGIVRLGSFEAILGFLLISGYSIGHSIQKKPEGFFLRRLWRIYPVYLAAVVLTYLVQRNPLTGDFLWNFALNLFFLGQIVVRYSYVNAGWTLGLEVWLYALAPIFARLRAAILELLIGASFLCYTFYTCGRSLWHWRHYAGTLYGINLPCLAFIWIAGFYLATAVRGRERPLKIAGLLFAGHLALGVAIQIFSRLKHHDLLDFVFVDFGGFFSNAILLLLIYLLFRCVIAHRFHLTLFQRRICRFFGDISYPLYLVHYPAFVLFSPGTHNAGLLLLGALALSTAVYFCCDFYSLRRKLA